MILLMSGTQLLFRSQPEVKNMSEAALNSPMSGSAADDDAYIFPIIFAVTGINFPWRDVLLTVSNFWHWASSGG